jgi:hypothetical protein
MHMNSTPYQPISAACPHLLLLLQLRGQQPAAPFALVAAPLLLAGQLPFFLDVAADSGLLRHLTYQTFVQCCRGAASSASVPTLAPAASVSHYLYLHGQAVPSLSRLHSTYSSSRRGQAPSSP